MWQGAPPRGAPLKCRHTRRSSLVRPQTFHVRGLFTVHVCCSSPPVSTHPVAGTNRASQTECGRGRRAPGPLARCRQGVRCCGHFGEPFGSFLKCSASTSPVTQPFRKCAHVSPTNHAPEHPERDPAEQPETWELSKDPSTGGQYKCGPLAWCGTPEGGEVTSAACTTAGHRHRVERDSRGHRPCGSVYAASRSRATAPWQTLSEHRDRDWAEDSVRGPGQVPASHLGAVWAAVVSRENSVSCTCRMRALFCISYASFGIFNKLVTVKREARVSWWPHVAGPGLPCDLTQGSVPSACFQLRM